MSIERTQQFRDEARRVLRWCAAYTRGLDQVVATGRQDEIASDLHEHAAWAAEQSMPARKLARSVRRRFMLGVPADLAWRRQQVRVASPSLRLALRTHAALLALLISTGVALTATGAFVVIRVIRALLIGDVAQIPVSTFAVTALTLIALVGTALLLRPRARVMGALLVAAPALLLLRMSGSVLWFVSASAVVAFNSAPWWSTAAATAGAGLSVLCCAAAAYWWGVDRQPTTIKNDEKGTAHV